MNKPDKILKEPKIVYSVQSGTSITKEEILNIDFDFIEAESYEYPDINFYLNAGRENPFYSVELGKYEAYLIDKKYKDDVAKEKRRKEYQKLKEEFQNDVD